jgi:hypothetical protein
MKNAVVYDMVGPYVVATTERWDYDNNLTQLNKMFEGAVDVIGLRPAMDGQIGYDAWVRDDALATGNAAAYRMQFSDEYFGVVFLPQTGKGLVILGVDEEGNTFGLTDEQALEAQLKLTVAPWKVVGHE